MAKKIYVTRVIPQTGIDLLRQHADVEVNESDTPLDEATLKEKAATHDALVTLLTDRIDRAVLEAGRHRLKIVSDVSVGFDNIDVPAATELGIAVTNTPDVLTETTADFAWALMMNVARRVCEAQGLLRAGNFEGWGIHSMLGSDIYGKTLGIVGFGRIGQSVGRRAAGFDMPVLYFDPVLPAEAEARHPGVRRVDLNTLLHDSDFVSIHAPLTPRTYHLIGPDQLRIMKQSAFLINTSRGQVVDEAALAEALKSCQIAGAGLDVFEHEPEVNPALLELSNVVLTPHIGSASHATRSRMATMAAENVIAMLEGRRPPQILNPEVLRGHGAS